MSICKKCHKNSVKKYCLMGLIILLGVVGCIATYLVPGNSNSENLLIEEGKDDSKEWLLRRNEYGGGDYKIRLKTQNEDVDYNISVEVNERKFTHEELDKLALDSEEKIREVILNSNKSLDEVSTDLNLINHLDGYPFSIRWKVSDEEIMDVKGKIVCPPDCVSIHEIILKAQLIYGKYLADIEIPIRVIPRKIGTDELLKYHIAEGIKDSTADESSTYIRLPSYVDGKEISWEMVNDNKGVLYLGLSIIGAMFLSVAYDYDLARENKKRVELLESQYPSFVEKLKLYMISGLAIPRVLEMIMKDLKENYDENDLLLEEVKKAVNLLNNGVREEKVYEIFGNDCKGSYKKLFFLLGINLRKGNDRILEMLEHENIKAQEMRKQLALKKSDEAGIKLLFPMILMLLVIMLLIMIPAYLNIEL